METQQKTTHHYVCLLESAAVDIGAARAVMDEAYEYTSKKVNAKNWEAQYFVTTTLPRISTLLYAADNLLYQLENSLQESADAAYTGSAEPPEVEKGASAVPTP